MKGDGLEALIYDYSRPGRRGCTLPPVDVPTSELPSEMLRDELLLPEVSEIDVVRHYVRLSQLNYAVDVGFYPLGSCTMKYNPKRNEVVARMPGYAQTHPYQPSCLVQGNLALMYGLQQALSDLSGFPAVSLQPSAGAHGEFAGVLVMRAYHEANGSSDRDTILIPDSAHGTNPASTAMCGYRVVEIKSDARGNVDLDDLRGNCDDRVAGMMLTNPNTLGLFDENVVEVAELVHRCGGLMYGDGANFNAIMGIVKPADVGFDVMHFNLHKTFSTPHGGGGPGSGPVGVTEELSPFLPGPVVEALEAPHECGCHDGDDEGCGCDHSGSPAADGKVDACSCGEAGPAAYYELKWPEQSVGQMKAFYGNFGVLVRAYAYIRTLGAAGLREASETAVLNANYLRVKLQETYPVAVDRTCMHEFVLAGPPDDADESVHTMDVAKRLIDLGHAHPPTVYFPLIVPEAMMIEPTETESKETLDRFVEDMRQIAQEARTEPDLLHEAPTKAPVRRLDEVRAARHPVLRYEP